MPAATEIPPRFPRLRKFVAALPNGLDSYPEQLIKSALLRTLTDEILAESLADLPEQLRDFVVNPRPVSAWTRQVHAHAVAAAARDIAFESDEAFARFCYDAQAKLFSSPLYRVLMWASSPRRVVGSIGTRWAAFNRGTSCVASELSAQDAKLQIQYPQRLFEPVSLVALAEGLKATLDLAAGRAGRKTSVELISVTATQADLALRW